MLVYALIFVTTIYTNFQISVICLGGTLILCALGWKWLNRDRAVAEQVRGLPPGLGTYKP